MPISTSLYTELRFAISDYMQRHEWGRLFEACRTNDDEASRTIAVIMAGYEAKNVWRFLDFVANMTPEIRKQKTGSVATCCYILGRVGQDNIRKSLTCLRQFLIEDPLVRDPACAALSNLWVMNPRKTASMLLNSWILKDNQNDLLQEVGISSCEYLASKDPKRVVAFLLEVSDMQDRKVAATCAKRLLRKYVLPSTSEKNQDDVAKHKLGKAKKRKRKLKKHKKKKHRK